MSLEEIEEGWEEEGSRKRGEIGEEGRWFVCDKR